jgi:hypothetical protein
MAAEAYDRRFAEAGSVFVTWVSVALPPAICNFGTIAAFETLGRPSMGSLLFQVACKFIVSVCISQAAVVAGGTDDGLPGF